MSLRPVLGALALLAAGALVLAAFRAVGLVYMGGWLLDLGSLAFPAPRYAAFWAVYAVAGLAAAGCFAAGLGRLAALPGRLEQIEQAFSSGTDSWWILAVSLLAFALAALVRAFVLAGAPLADDESCYRFSAQLLAHFTLKAPSPPMKLFFDRSFMINDGSFYSQYPLGWPLLMAPGVLVGASGYMNALYSALTLPAIFLVVRRLLGSGWARLGALLWVLAPMLTIGAATELSHTSCTMALAWATWLALRSWDRDAPLRTHAFCATVLSLAFLIRPTAGLGIGAPLFVYWLVGLSRRPAGSRLRPAIAFLVPAIAMASLFLGVNAAQTGSPFLLAYERARQYAQENGYRFTHFRPLAAGRAVDLDFASPLVATAKTGVALWRLNASLFGWPLSLLFVPFAGGRAGARLMWACAASFVAVHFFALDSGIDAFGPVHFFEMALPLAVLTVLGLERLTSGAQRAAGGAPDSPGARGRRVLPVASAGALSLVALLVYAPVEGRALARIAADVNAPFRAARRAGLHDAVVFSPWFFTPQCLSHPTRHFVYWRPNNDPALRNPILWVNHVSVEEDRKLMSHFPDRQGFVLVWEAPCTPVFVPLDRADPRQIPPGRVSLGPPPGAAGAGE